MNTLLVVSALLLAADTNPMAHPDGLVVHEWGTFTSIAGDDGGPVDWDALGCKNDLPRFVNDYGYRGFKWRLNGTVRMETPVLYFYSGRDVEARVKVAFPHGLITEWYPKADYQVDQTTDGVTRRITSNLNRIDTTMRTVTGTIEWNKVKIQPNASSAFPVEGDLSSHYFAARATDSDPLTVGAQSEKFLFYRGVGRFPIPLSAQVGDQGRVMVATNGPEPVPTVILFANHNGKVAYRLASNVSGRLNLDAPSADSGGIPRQDLEAALVAQGLFLKEARAMVETWHGSWFEEGSRLIYLLPQPAVDSILPLQIDPVPARTVRVFVGRIELLAPETRRTLVSAIASQDWAAVERYERFLAPMLRQMFAGNVAKASQVEQQFREYQRLHEVQGCR